MLLWSRWKQEDDGQGSGDHRQEEWYLLTKMMLLLISIDAGHHVNLDRCRNSFCSIGSKWCHSDVVTYLLLTSIHSFLIPIFSFVDVGKCQPVFKTTFDCVPGKKTTPLEMSHSGARWAGLYGISLIPGKMDKIRAPWLKLKFSWNRNNSHLDEE